MPTGTASIESRVQLILPHIPQFDDERALQVTADLSAQARPPGAFSRLETIAAQLAGIQASRQPIVNEVTAFVFAGDHGLTRSGVSAYPPSVTAAMVRTLLTGRATANAVAAACGVDVKVVDAGVDADLAHPKLIGMKVAGGTANAVERPAMTVDEAIQSIQTGIDLGRSEVASGRRAIVLGEMGIGNTASSSLLLHRLAPADLEDCVGPGAGQSDSGMRRKLLALRAASARTSASGAFEVLCEFGGFEIAMMAGAAMGAASERGAVLVDGFISTVAALVAVRLEPKLAKFLIYGHKSGEPGHRIALAALDAEPLLNLGLRLGEGTGAILATPIVRAAAGLTHGVASLSDVLGQVQ